MKKEFFERPASLRDREMYGFDWLEHVAAIPAPLALVTGYKANGLPNATLQSWMCFANDGGYYCIFGDVNKRGHMYASVSETKQLVVNLPSADIYKRCLATIEHNRYEDDELALAGLTAAPARKVNAPMVGECFLNLECEYAWERELRPGGEHVVLCAKVVNIWMDDEHYRKDGAGRYGETGYLYNVHSPINPETGEEEETYLAVLQKLKTYDEL